MTTRQHLEPPHPHQRAQQPTPELSTAQHSTYYVPAGKRGPQSLHRLRQTKYNCSPDELELYYTIRGYFEQNLFDEVAGQKANLSIPPAAKVPPIKHKVPPLKHQLPPLKHQLPPLKHQPPHQKPQQATEQSARRGLRATRAVPRTQRAQSPRGRSHAYHPNTTGFRTGSPPQDTTAPPPPPATTPSPPPLISRKSPQSTSHTPHQLYSHPPPLDSAYVPRQPPPLDDPPPPASGTGTLGMLQQRLSPVPRIDDAVQQSKLYHSVAASSEMLQQLYSQRKGAAPRPRAQAVDVTEALRDFQLWLYMLIAESMSLIQAQGVPSADKGRLATTDKKLAAKIYNNKDYYHQILQTTSTERSRDEPGQPAATERAPEEPGDKVVPEDKTHTTHTVQYKDSTLAQGEQYYQPEIRVEQVPREVRQLWTGQAAHDTPLSSTVQQPTHSSGPCTNTYTRTSPFIQSTDTESAEQEQSVLSDNQDTASYFSSHNGTPHISTPNISTPQVSTARIGTGRTGTARIGTARTLPRIGERSRSRSVESLESTSSEFMAAQALHNYLAHQYALVKMQTSRGQGSGAGRGRRRYFTDSGDVNQHGTHERFLVTSRNGGLHSATYYSCMSEEQFGSWL